MLPGVTTLREPLTRALGPKTGKALENALGMATVGDLLRHYPRRYYSRGELTDLSSLREGDHVTVLARIANVSLHPMPQGGPRMRGEVIITDDRAKLMLTFFFRNPGAQHKFRGLKPDVVGMFAGTVSSFRGRLQLIHPEYELLPGAPPNADLTPELAAEFATELIPVYPATAKVSSWVIGRSIKAILDPLDTGEDPLPAEVRERYGLYGRAEALRAIHRPLDWADRDRARERLKWDEAFMLQAALAQRRMAAAALPAMPRPHVEAGIADEFDARLPFTLTAGQVAVGETIAHDLACAYPMHRLLQGEVGSGKTVIAIRAMLQVVDAGGQATLLAPTEVLAQQHYRSVTAMLGPLAQRGQLGGADHATGVALLTGSVSAGARRSALSDVFTGDAGIVIGTHALLEERVQFADLGLVVIDEQHRFGVEQRDALRAKAADNRPHVLVMTATPIPRTVAMTVYGDLETSTLTELPAGRSAIATHVVPAADKPHFLERAWARVKEEVQRGRQAYVVCPRIGDGPDPDDAAYPDWDNAANPGADAAAYPGPDAAAYPGPDAAAYPGPDAAAYPGPDDFASMEPTTVDLSHGVPRSITNVGRRQPLSVLDVAATLDAGPLAGLRLGILHGKLHPDEKDRVMRAFSAGEIDVLVATTVIEVGVDVPNATVMVIMDAERFGVSQLHQLRGRVGRGAAPGLCLLVTEAPPASPARERLDAVAATLDGFQLSRLDLEQRREGDVLGAAQAGRHSSLRLLQLLKDEDLIGQARTEATAIVSADPDLARHPALRAAIEDLLGVQAEYLDKT
jgi:ATP-dependent DNA helicase RecG